MGGRGGNAICWVLVATALNLALADRPALAASAGARPAESTVDQAVIAAADAYDFDTLRARGPAVLPDLVALYQERLSDAAARARVASAFYQLGWKSDDAATLLLADVQAADTDEALRVAAQYALGRVSDAPVVVESLLANMRRGETFYVRDKAACALAYDQIHLSEAQKVLLFEGLIAALADPADDVRKIAIQALAIHTGQMRGFHPAFPPERRQAAIENWQRWLAEYKANL